MTQRPSPDLPSAPAAMPFAATLASPSRQRVKRTLLIWLVLVSSFLLTWYFLVPAA